MSKKFRRNENFVSLLTTEMSKGCRITFKEVPVASYSVLAWLNLARARIVLNDGTRNIVVIPAVFGLMLRETNGEIVVENLLGDELMRVESRGEFLNRERAA